MRIFRGKRSFQCITSPDLPYDGDDDDGEDNDLLLVRITITIWCKFMYGAHKTPYMNYTKSKVKHTDFHAILQKVKKGIPVSITYIIKLSDLQVETRKRLKKHV